MPLLKTQRHEISTEMHQELHKFAPIFAKKLWGFTPGAYKCGRKASAFPLRVCQPSHFSQPPNLTMSRAIIASDSAREVNFLGETIFQPLGDAAP